MIHLHFEVSSMNPLIVYVVRLHDVALSDLDMPREDPQPSGFSVSCRGAREERMRVQLGRVQHLASIGFKIFGLN